MNITVQKNHRQPTDNVKILVLFFMRLSVSSGSRSIISFP